MIVDRGFGVQSVFTHIKAVVAKVDKHAERGEVIGQVGGDRSVYRA
jgi:hypothetical protein